MKNQKNKLTLDQFKAKAEDSQESLSFISGGILGACHDETEEKKIDGGTAHEGTEIKF